MTLLPDVPREIRTPLVKAATMLMAVGLMASPLLGVLAIIGPNVLKYQRLAEGGIEGWAFITKLHDSTTRNGGHAHQASYNYTIGGFSYTGKDSLIYERDVDLRPDARLPILYDPTAPGTSVVNRGITIQDRYKDLLQHFKLIGSLAALPFLFTVLIVSLQYLKERRLLKWGVAVPATIVAEERCQSSRGSESITLHYQFVDATGTIYRGERKGLPLPEKADRFDRARRQRLMGRPVALYHPRHPELNTLYPLDWVELRYEMPIMSGEISA